MQTPEIAKPTGTRGYAESTKDSEPRPPAAAIHLITILYKSEAGLSAFMDSLQAQDMRDWRLYIVDNASPDSSGDIIAGRPDPRITVVRNATNLGFAKAANQGLRAAELAGGDFFLLINNDTTFAPDFLRRLIEEQSKLGAGVIAPRIMRRERPEIAWYAGGGFEDGWVFTNVHYYHHDPDEGFSAFRVDFAPGCCLGICREVLAQVGLLDESFFVYWEDTDFCMRLKERGIPIFYVSEPSLLHSGGASSGGEFSPTYTKLYNENYVKFLRKHFGFRHAAQTVLRLILRELGRPARYRQVRLMGMAMLFGLAAPLVAPTKLDPDARRVTPTGAR